MISRVGHSPLGAFIRSPLGVLGAEMAGNVAVIAVADYLPTLSGAQIIDGVTLPDKSLVLIANNGSSGDINNGIYVSSTSGAWSRKGTIKSGMIVTVLQGVDYSNTVWMCSNVAPIVIATTTLVFTLMTPRDLRVVTASTFINQSTISGTQTIDGISCGAGKYVLLCGQTTGSQNGVYRIPSSGGWIKLPQQPTAVLCQFGATNFQTVFYNYGGNTWYPALGDVHSANAASPDNMSLPLTGTQTIDGQTINTGYVLLYSQSTASENGLYLIPSPSTLWIKLSFTPKIIPILFGNTNSLLTFFLTAPNTWEPNEGVYA